jgi:hypothetical protein
MPAPPAAPAEGEAAPSQSRLNFSRYARPAEEGLTTPNTAPLKTEEPTPISKPDEAAPPKEEPKTEPEEPQTTEEPDEYEEEAPATETPAPEKPSAEAKPKKPNPWKLLEEHKTARKQLEQEVVELKKLVPNEKEAKAVSEKLTAAEARVAELEDHLRYVDYQNHPEFKQKYEQPYIDKWQSILRRVQGVQITDANGNRRVVQPADIQKLGSLPADQAIELAESMFGKLGNWVAERVEELKTLEESKFSALENAKKDAGRMKESMSAQQKEVQDFLAKTWSTQLEQSTNGTRYAKFFKPAEGDVEWNSRLEKGFEGVDKALSADPRDPRLSNEQRAQITREIVKMRNKAASFGVLNLTIRRLESKLADAESRLSKYESSTPSVEGQGAPEPQQPAPQGSEFRSSFERTLQKYARPGVV